MHLPIVTMHAGTCPAYPLDQLAQLVWQAHFEHVPFQAFADGCSLTEAMAALSIYFVKH